MSVVSVLKTVFLFEKRVKVHLLQNCSAEQPLKRGLSRKTRCSRFALLGLLQLNLHDSVQLCLCYSPSVQLSL